MAIAEPTRSFIALGGNLGDPAQAFDAALAALQQRNDTCVLRCSSRWRTAPHGPSGQADYLNAVCELATELDAAALLGVLKQLESDAGRDFAAERWSARVLDIDILIHGEQCIDSPSLTVPHPRLAERRFVLEPLNELAPELIVPGLDRSVAELLQDTGDQSRCNRIDKQGNVA